MTTATAVKGVIAAVVPLEASSKAGHDQLMIFVALPGETGEVIEVWETLSPADCKKGRNAGKSFRECRLEELGARKDDEGEFDLASLDSVMSGHLCVVAQRAMRNGEDLVLGDDGEPRTAWRMRAVLPQKVKLD